jgi:ketosteroid isomerase-like protein
MNEVQQKICDEIFRLERAANEHWQKGDLDFLDDEIITTETIQLTPGMPKMDGVGYSKWMREISAVEGVNFSFEPTDVVVSQSGEMAYVIGETKLEQVGEETRFGKFVSIWKDIDGNGKWRCVVEANNFNDA